MIVTRTSWLARTRAVASPAKPPPMITTWGRAEKSGTTGAALGDVAIALYSIKRHSPALSVGQNDDLHRRPDRRRASAPRAARRRPKTSTQFGRRTHDP